MDIDAAGGAATGGLLAGALEKPGGHAGDLHGNCTDCGQAVSGNFCANCGQPTHVHRTLLHLGEELLHGVIHFDGRIWRTLPLLMLNPGRLTREWIQGRRTRYVSPLAIFLFSVFLMFFVFSFAGGHGGEEQTLDQRIAATEASLVEARAELAEATAGLDDPAGSDTKTYTDAGERVAVGVIEGRLTELRAAKASGGRADGLEPGTWQANIAESARSGKMNINTGNKTLDKAILKKALNPDLALYKIQQTTYKFSFLLIPLSIPFVALLFLWRRGSTLYDHGVFVLYSLTAMSILMMAAVLIGPLWGPLAVVAGLATTFGPPVHMFAQLKGTYGLSWFSALWRTIALLIFCSIVLALFLLVIVMLGLTG
jgi:hypothetical protein